MADALTLRFRKTLPKGAQIDAELQVGLEPPVVTVLFGPSGSGKTTILRALAGLERSANCVIHFGHETWVDGPNGVFIPPQRRRIGFLFQDYALFSHLTVSGNIRYGLHGFSANEQKLRISELLERFQLRDLAARYPHQLSGGAATAGGTGSHAGAAPTVASAGRTAFGVGRPDSRNFARRAARSAQLLEDSGPARHP